MPANAPDVTIYVNAIQERTQCIIPGCFMNYPWNALSAIFIGGLLWQLLTRPLPQFIGYVAFSMFFTTVWLKHAGVIVTRNHILVQDYYKMYGDSVDLSSKWNKRRLAEGPCGLPLGCCDPPKKKNQGGKRISL